MDPRVIEAVAYGFTFDGQPLVGERHWPDDVMPSVDGGCVACMMSGGVDSTLVAAKLVNLGCEVHGFNLDWGMSGDESVYAADVAKALGVRLHVVRMGVEKYAGLMGEWLGRHPRAGIAYLPVLMAVKEYGFETVFSGEGGDELFAGYAQRYSRMMRYWHSRLRGFPGVGLASFLPGKTGRYARILSRSRDWASFYAAWQTRLPQVQLYDRLKPWNDDDWMVATMRLEEEVKLGYYMDALIVLADEVGVKLRFPLMGYGHDPHRWREYWDGGLVGKKPLRDELFSLSPEACEIASRPKHGFSPPDIDVLWDAGLCEAVMSGLEGAPINSVLSDPLPSDPIGLWAVADACAIHRWLESNGVAYWK